MSTKTERICALNDQLRQDLTSGTAFITAGVAALGAATIEADVVITGSPELHRRAPESTTNNPLKRNAAGDLTIVPPPAAAPTRRPEQVSRARESNQYE